MKLHKIIFNICLTASLTLIVAGFILPPTGEIDNSVLTASGILLGFASLGIFGNALDKNKVAKFEKNDLTLEIGKKNESH